jgi:hypothetical protein
MRRGIFDNGGSGLGARGSGFGIGRAPKPEAKAGDSACAPKPEAGDAWPKPDTTLVRNLKPEA